MRFVLLCAAAALAVSGCTKSDLSPVHAVGASSATDAAAAASLISAYRVSRGLSPVAVDPRLNRAAEHQARVVAAAGRLSHGDFGERMQQYGILGYAAENLSAGTDGVGEAVNQWKASPGHNQNLLLPEVRRIGLARADSKSRYGRYWALVLGE
ncbi:MAG TPA: CAP domain-containing protein [Microvirga sp.]|nr:CAP domain-containing protein [Microvirga sp.]